MSYSERGPCAATTMRCGHPAASATPTRPSSDASGMNGPSTSRSAWSTTGMFTAFETMPPSSAATTCSATISPARSCASSVEAARCGVTTTWSSSSSGPVYGSAEKTSSAAPGELARVERLDQRLLVDERPAGGVDEPRAVPHPGDRLAVDHAAGLVGQRRVQRDDVGDREESSSRVSACSTPSSRNRRPDERIVGDDCHPEPGARRRPADRCGRTRHAERLAASSIPLQRDRSQRPLLERGVRLRDVPGERDDQPDRLLCSRDDGRLGRVRDDDAAACRRFDVDVVDPDTGATDHLEARRAAR